MRITKSEISMRTWRSPMSAASQGAFVVIPEISHSDISYIKKKLIMLDLQTGYVGYHNHEVIHMEVLR